ncbi:unnamed protein product, partial [Closterium sp. NIES-54]
NVFFSGPSVKFSLPYTIALLRECPAAPRSPCPARCLTCCLTARARPAAQSPRVPRCPEPASAPLPCAHACPAAQRLGAPRCPAPERAPLPRARACLAAQRQPMPHCPALMRAPLPCARVRPAVQRQRVPRCPVPVRALLPRARAPLSCPGSAARTCPASELVLLLQLPPRTLPCTRCPCLPCCALVLLLQLPPARCPAPCPASTARACPAAHSCCCCNCHPHAALHRSLVALPMPALLCTCIAAVAAARTLPCSLPCLRFCAAAAACITLTEPLPASTGLALPTRVPVLPTRTARAPLPCPASPACTLSCQHCQRTPALPREGPALKRPESLSPQELREWVIWWGSPGGGASRARAGGAGAGGTRTRRQETLSSQQLLKRAVCPSGGGFRGTRTGGVEAPSGVEAAILGAFNSASAGAEPAEALHTFTLDTGASRCFFRDSTTVTPLTASVPITLSDPSGGPVVARGATVLPCPVASSGLLIGLHLPSFAKNFVATSVLQDQWVNVTQLGGELVAICTDSRTGEHLATFTRRPGSGLYTLTTESALVAALGQVAASVVVATSCSCCLC